MKQPENIKVCNDNDCTHTQICNRYQPQIQSVPKHIEHIEAPNGTHVCSYLLRGNKAGKLTQSKPGFAHNN